MATSPPRRSRRCHRWALALLATLVAPGCSENFGRPPLPTGEPVAARNERMAGPVVPRAGLQLAGRGSRPWLATDRGVFRVDLGRTPARFEPGHPGFFADDGSGVFAPLSRLAVGESGQVVLLVARTGGDDFPAASADGGASFRQLDLPDVLARTADDALAVDDPPTLLLRQGAILYHADPPGGAWVASALPAVPDQLGRLGQGDGGVVLSARVGGAWTAWHSPDGGRQFVATGARLPSAGQSLGAVAGGGWAVATLDSLLRPADRRALPQGTATAVDLVTTGGLGLLVERAGQLSHWDGRAAAEADHGPLASGPASGRALVATVSGGHALLDDASVQGAMPGPVRLISFAGGDLAATALAAAGDREVVLGLGSGAVHRGRPGEPLVPRGSPLVQSRSNVVQPDPEADGAIFAGSFGLYRQLAPGAPWEDRNAGLFNYRLDCFGCTFPVFALHDAGAGVMWLGGVDGNGPYRSTDGGRQWARQHAGLGAPGSRPGEDGLPLVPVVRAFASTDSSTLMAGFRGGLWEWTAGRGVWSQRNRGLPDLAGTPVDSCCVDGLDREVDVRDVARLADGSLLAATAWGCWRMPARGTGFAASSEGLRNGDAWGLAVHPSRPGWVALATREAAGRPGWLYLSRDGGVRWQLVEATPQGWWAQDLVWSDPARDELTVRLDGGGAWTLEVEP